MLRLKLNHVSKRGHCWCLSTPWSVLISRANSMFVPSQWEMSVQSNAVSHWLGANLESALLLVKQKRTAVLRSAFYWYGLTLIPALVSKYINCNAWGEITYLNQTSMMPLKFENIFVPSSHTLFYMQLLRPTLYFTREYFIPHFIVHVITYTCWNLC